MSVYLDTLELADLSVGYGTLGRGGSLGYERKRVRVGGRRYPHALSTHPPARLRFRLDGRFGRFRCQVALNDDVAPGRSRAEFTVVADGCVVTSGVVEAGERPVLLEADLGGTDVLELLAETDAWDFCHAIWLDPLLERVSQMARPESGPAEVLFVDQLPMASSSVGYGSVGLAGDLGYDGKQVSIAGQPRSRSLSTHADARLAFELDGRFTRFACQVALNDDVWHGASHAHFLVRADSRLVAVVPYVTAGDPPRDVQADISGARRLELVVETDRWPFCHAVWVDPCVDTMAAHPTREPLVDPLQRALITAEAPLPSAQRCIATIASAGFAHHLDDMLGSLRANGDCPEALVVVFVVDADGACKRVAADHGATVIHCAHRSRVNSTVKSVLYSVARVVDAEQFICLDADMLVVGSLRPLFAAIETAPVGSVLACREANGPRYANVEHAIHHVYGGRPSDIPRIVGGHTGAGVYPLVVNDGTFAAGRTALLTLDGLIRRWTAAPGWVDERRDVWWRNQFVFNLALAHLDCGVEIGETFNIQLNSQDVELRDVQGRIEAIWNSQPVNVLHFNGNGRNKYPEWRGKYPRSRELMMTGAG